MRRKILLKLTRKHELRRLKSVSQPSYLGLLPCEQSLNVSWYIIENKKLLQGNNFNYGHSV